MKKGQDRLIVALDVSTFKEADTLIGSLGEVVNIYKVGSQLFTACGPDIVRFIINKGKKVFLDLKFHDIPNTVANAVASSVALTKDISENGVFMLTLHIAGGKEMLEMARKSAHKTAKELGVRKPIVLGVTVLTSEEKGDNIRDIVLKRALLAKDSGLDGVVSSGQEVGFLRKKLGKGFILVTPGIRPKDAEAGDQIRITSPSDAILNGSDYLVVGRPIVKAFKPLSAALQILKEIDKIRTKTKN